MTAPAASLAFLAGVVSFFSPCVVSLVPGYLAAAGRGTTLVVLRRTALFIAGFTVVFAALGASASVVGQVLLAYRSVLARVGGVVMVVMGLHLAGWLTLPFLNREARFHPQGGASSLVLGMAVGFGWTPCVGPILASILLLAGSQGTAGRGAGLLAIYALGLAVPFTVSGLLLARIRSPRLAGVGARLQAAGGVMMAAIGVLLLTGRLYYLSIAAQRLFSRLGIDLWTSF